MNKQFKLYTFALCLFFPMQVLQAAQACRWNWEQVDTMQPSELAAKIPPQFLFGTATSAYQTEGAIGCPASNWAKWETDAITKNLHKKPTGQPYDPSGVACDSRHFYEKDIACLQELGVNSYRFSVDWSRIEPQRGVINQDALDHYEMLCEQLLKVGIKPVVTLHHFSHPQWFEECGAFEKEENIPLFVQFCELVFKRLGDKVALWCTINEPTVMLTQGYVRGVFPPGKSGISGMRLGWKALNNMLKTHCEVYKALKQLPGGDIAQIGFAHGYLIFKNFHGWKSPAKLLIESGVATLCTWAMSANNYVINFFAKDENKRYLDFIGINYYSDVFLRLYHRTENSIHPGYVDESISNRHALWIVRRRFL